MIQNPQVSPEGQAHKKPASYVIPIDLIKSMGFRPDPNGMPGNFIKGDKDAWVSLTISDGYVCSLRLRTPKFRRKIASRYRCESDEHFKFLVSNGRGSSF